MHLEGGSAKSSPEKIWKFKNARLGLKKNQHFH
jgi:hypothetical protein